MVVEQGTVSVAAVLAALPGMTAVRVNDKVWGGRLDEKSPLRGRSDQLFRHRGPHMPTDDVFNALILEGARVGPCVLAMSRCVMLLTHTRLARVGRG